MGASKKWNDTLLRYVDEAQDEYAIATMMYDMRAYIEEGREVYPMAEALEDAYIYLLMQEATDNPGCKIKPQNMPWQCS